jgi:hypothetical protein
MDIRAADALASSKPNTVPEHQSRKAVHRSKNGTDTCVSSGALRLKTSHTELTDTYRV